MNDQLECRNKLILKHVALVLRWAMAILLINTGVANASTLLPADINVTGITISIPTSNTGAPYPLYANGYQQAPVSIKVFANKKIDPKVLTNAVYLYNQSTGQKIPWNTGSVHYTDVRNKYQFGVLSQKSSVAQESPMYTYKSRAPISSNDLNNFISRKEFYLSTTEVGATLNICAAVMTAKGEIKTCPATDEPQDVVINAVKPIQYSANDFTWISWIFYEQDGTIWADDARVYYVYFNDSKMKTSKLYHFQWNKQGGLPLTYGHRHGWLVTPPVKYDNSARTTHINASYFSNGRNESTNTSSPYVGYIVMGSGTAYTPFPPGTGYFNNAGFVVGDQYGNHSTIYEDLQY